MQPLLILALSAAALVGTVHAQTLYKSVDANGQAAPSTPAAAQSRGKVALSMAIWCGYCKAAKAYLGGKGIAYQEFDVGTPTGKAALAQIGARGVPVQLANGQRINGFSTPSYDAVFAKRP